MLELRRIEREGFDHLYWHENRLDAAKLHNLLTVSLLIDCNGMKWKTLFPPLEELSKWK